MPAIRSLLVLALGALFALVSAHPRSFIPRGVGIPDQDPFYDPPKGWEDKEPGDILRVRKIQPGTLEHVKWNIEGYQLLYRTTGTYEDKPSHTVTTILVPKNSPKDKLLSLQAYIDAGGAQCSPSYTLQQGANVEANAAMSLQNLIWNAFLSLGYAVSIPDHQGPKFAFAAGPLEGRMTLDGMRAALNFDKLGLHKHAKVVGYGYSGGAIATGWAASLQRNYAPELNMAGWALGGTPANITSTVLNLDGGLFAGFAVTGLTGVLQAYRDLARKVEGRITKAGHNAINYARHHCLVANLLKFPFTRVQGERFVRNGEHIFTEPDVAEVLNTLVMGEKKEQLPTAPVLIIHSKNDEVIPYWSAKKLAQSWARMGGTIKFLTNTDVFMEHVTTESLNTPTFATWFQNRFDGKKLKKGLHTQTIGNPLDTPQHVPEAIKEVWHLIQDLVGKEIGGGDKRFKEKIKLHAAHNN